MVAFASLRYRVAAAAVFLLPSLAGATWWGPNGGPFWQPGWAMQTLPPFQSQLTPADTFFSNVTENYERQYLLLGQPPPRRPVLPPSDSRSSSGGSR